MPLLYVNLATVSLCCFLLIGGFAGRHLRAGPVAMIAGMAGLMAVIYYNIRVLANLS